MAKILLITHGPLAEALVETSNLILGETSKIHTMGLYLGDDPEFFKLRVSDKIDELNDADGLIILTDLFGGTPSNSVVEKLHKLKFPKNIICFTGVNLPILLEAMTLSDYLDIISIQDSLNATYKDTLKNIMTIFQGIS